VYAHQAFVSGHPGKHEILLQAPHARMSLQQQLEQLLLWAQAMLLF